MGSWWWELGMDTHKLTAMATTLKSMTALLTLVLLVSPCLSHSLQVVRREAEPMSLADGDAEPIYAMNGFYGNPLYRPYGFGSWGWGSAGYGLNRVVVKGNNIYGGYFTGYRGFY